MFIINKLNHLISILNKRIIRPIGQKKKEELLNKTIQFHKKKRIILNTLYRKEGNIPIPTIRLRSAISLALSKLDF